MTGVQTCALPILRDDADGGGGAHVDGNDGRRELFQRRHGVRHNVRSYLGLDCQPDVQSCLDAGTHHHRRAAQKPRHLNGYDHEKPTDEEKMFKLQREILEGYGLTR